MRLGRLATCVALLGCFAIQAEEKCGNCPISGKPAKKDNVADYKGKKVYLCCEGCPDEFKKDPTKFAAKTNLQLFLTGQIVQVGCPFSGGPVNKDTETKFEGTKISFCCAKCKAKFDKAEDKTTLAFASAKGFTFQDKCPISGKPIKADQTVEHNGKKVYFCCEGCPAAFKKDPEKHAGKLPKE